MKRVSVWAVVVGMATAGAAQAAENPAHIVGIAHTAYSVSDLAKAPSYYDGLLGFQQVPVAKKLNGDHVASIKINDRQFIEVIAEPAKNHGFVHDAGFADDIEAALAAVNAAGLVPTQIALCYPDGNRIELMEPLKA